MTIDIEHNGTHILNETQLCELIEERDALKADLSTAFRRTMDSVALTESIWRERCTEFEREYGALVGLIPPTFYADLEPEDRMRLLVEKWVKLHEVNQTLEQECAAMEKKASDLKFTIENYTEATVYNLIDFIDSGIPADIVENTPGLAGVMEAIRHHDAEKDRKLAELAAALGEYQLYRRHGISTPKRKPHAGRADVYRRLEALMEIRSECDVNMQCHHSDNGDECGDIDDCLYHTLKQIVDEALPAYGKKTGNTDASSGWETTKTPQSVTEHSLVIGSVLCRWWGENEPPGAKLIAALAAHGKERT